MERRRAERLDIKRSREAAEAVRTVRPKISAWQHRLVYLRALVEHQASEGQPAVSIAAEAQRIQSEIEAHRRMLHRRAEELPLEISNHSRFQDIVRALATASHIAVSVLNHR